MRGLIQPWTVAAMGSVNLAVEHEMQLPRVLDPRMRREEGSSNHRWYTKELKLIKLIITMYTS